VHPQAGFVIGVDLEAVPVAKLVQHVDASESGSDNDGHVGRISCNRRRTCQERFLLTPSPARRRRIELVHWIGMLQLQPWLYAVL